MVYSQYLKDIYLKSLDTFDDFQSKWWSEFFNKIFAPLRTFNSINSTSIFKKLHCSISINPSRVVEFYTMFFISFFSIFCYFFQ